jgi:penicillin-binding protein 1C
MPALAPHAADAVLAAAPGRRLHRLTIDAALRSRSKLARERARALGPDLSVAILAVDNATGEVLARVASADCSMRLAPARSTTQALRSPGSTLKPFIYGLGFEDGLIHRDPDRGPPGALWRLCAGEFRSHLPRHRDGAQGAATVAQRSRGRGA